MKILVIGAGIGGLTAATLLERKGFSVTLIERAPEFRHIGFGLSIFGNGRRILKILGIEKKIAEKSYEIPWLNIVTPEGAIVGASIDFKGLIQFGEPTITLERSILHEALIRGLDKTNLRLGTTIHALQNHPSGALVTLSDGTTDTFDLVIAADGIHSQIRDSLFGTGQSSFYDWSVRAFWIPEYIPIPEGAVCVSTKQVTLAIYPLKGKSFAGMYEYNPKRINNPPLNLTPFLPYLLSRGWTKTDIEKVTAESKTGQQFYDHLRYIKLDEWYKNRVVLLGDARHGFSPIIGMGGALALEDAFVMADELSKQPTKIPSALKAYSFRRTARIKEVRSLSNLVERFYFIKSPLEETLRNGIARIFPRNIMPRKLERIVGGTL